MYQTSCSSIAEVIKTDSLENVGKATSYFLLSLTVFYRSKMHVPLFLHYVFILGKLVMPLPPLSVNLLVWLRPLGKRFLGSAVVLVTS